jgi:hypothetical protein
MTRGKPPTCRTSLTKIFNDITEILLKVALNTINQPINLLYYKLILILRIGININSNNIFPQSY